MFASRVAYRIGDGKLRDVLPLRATDSTYYPLGIVFSDYEYADRFDGSSWREFEEWMCII